VIELKMQSQMRVEDKGTRGQGDKKNFSLSPFLHVSLSADSLIAFLLAFASFLLYLRTLAPDVVDADGGEFQFAAWNFSFAHPTGYPLYLILGGIFQHLVPIGNPAYRLNMFTAITASLAVAMLFLIVDEIVRHRGAAMMAAASFALTRMFWYDATAAETYAFNAFFIALLIYIALRWQANPNFKTFALFCFAYGLALTHHRTSILWMPAFAVFYLVSSFKVSGFSYHTSRITFYFLLFAFAFLLPLLLYLYIPLRAPAAPYNVLPLAPGHDLVLYDNSVTGFINYLLGRTFQSELKWDQVSVARLVSFPQALLDQFGIVGVALGLLGIVVMLWKKREAWARFGLLTLGFIATLLFASIYHIGDIEHYYIPTYLVWAIWIGCAISFGFESLYHVPRITYHVLRIACSVFLIGFLITQFLSNLPYADRSGETRARTQWTRILSSSIPQNAILISNDRDEMMPMWYMQYVENTRRDLLGLFPIITPAPEHANIVRLTDSVIDLGRPIYFIKPMPGLEIKYRLANETSLTRVVGRANATPQFKSNAMVGDRMRIIGYDATRESNTLRVAIYWQAQSKLDANYTTFMHLIDTNENKIAQGNDHLVGGDFYPTSMWMIGETLRDEQIVELPQNLAPGAYHLRVGMYRQADGEMLGEAAELSIANVQ
jgi:hypothetical protein